MVYLFISFFLFFFQLFLLVLFLEKSRFFFYLPSLKAHRYIHTSVIKRMLFMRYSFSPRTPSYSVEIPSVLKNTVQGSWTSPQYVQLSTFHT